MKLGNLLIRDSFGIGSLFLLAIIVEGVACLDLKEREEGAGHSHHLISGPGKVSGLVAQTFTNPNNVH